MMLIAPIPWRIDAEHVEGLLSLRDVTGDAFAEVNGTREIDRNTAEYIVRAVNAHEALLTAAEATLKVLKASGPSQPGTAAIGWLSAAIALARGESVRS